VESCYGWSRHRGGLDRGSNWPRLLTRQWLQRKEKGMREVGRAAGRHWATWRKEDWARNELLAQAVLYLFFSISNLFQIQFYFQMKFKLQIQIYMQQPETQHEYKMYIFLYVYFDCFIPLFRQRLKIWHAHILFCFRKNITFEYVIKFQVKKYPVPYLFRGKQCILFLLSVTLSWIYFYLRAFFKFSWGE
jgi:hypothetical protein